MFFFKWINLKATQLKLTQNLFQAQQKIISGTLWICKIYNAVKKKTLIKIDVKFAVIYQLLLKSI